MATKQNKEVMLDVLIKVKYVWDREGFGEDANESEVLYREVCQAIADATGNPCHGILGAIQPR